MERKLEKSRQIRKRRVWKVLSIIKDGVNKLSGHKKDYFTMSLAEMEIELINFICEKIEQPDLDRIESFFNFVYKRYSKKVSSFNDAIDLSSLSTFDPCRSPR